MDGPPPVGAVGPEVRLQGRRGVIRVAEDVALEAALQRTRQVVPGDDSIEIRISRGEGAGRRGRADRGDREEIRRILTLVDLEVDSLQIEGAVLRRPRGAQTVEGRAVVERLVPEDQARAECELLAPDREVNIRAAKVLELGVRLVNRNLTAPHPADASITVEVLERRVGGRLGGGLVAERAETLHLQNDLDVLRQVPGHAEKGAVREHAEKIAGVTVRVEVIVEPVVPDAEFACDLELFVAGSDLTVVGHHGGQRHRNHEACHQPQQSLTHRLHPP